MKPEIPEELKECEVAIVHKVDTVNFKPHPFVVGPKHITHASQYCGGILGKETMQAIPCAHCGRRYEEHTYDTVVFIKLKRNCTASEIQPWLKEIAEKVTRIDGFAFIETEQNYRIQG
jgi:hypothetical protein